MKLVISGAGMVGLSAALGLQKAGHEVVLIEKNTRPEYTEKPELRVSAIAPHSQQLLETLGVWQQLPLERLGAYQKMQVWDHDSFGEIEFNAQDVGSARLGTIVENKVIEQALWDQALQAGVTIKTDCTIERFDVTPAHVNVQLKDGTQLLADYLLATDGVGSRIRQQAGLPVTAWDYEQQGIVAVISTEQAHSGVARQVFLPSGPIAWLPLADPHQVSLVWSADTDVAQSLLNASDADFIKQLQAASDQCLGQLTLASKRAAFPLKMQYCQRWVDHRVLVLGDAAHSIHPLAGQGANLGFGDVASLLAIDSKVWNKRDLRHWERERKAQAVEMIATMELFKRGFGTRQPALKLLRGLGFKLADKVRGLKKQLMKAAL